MKNIILILLVLLVSCLSETEKEKIDNSIMDKMYYKAKLSSPNKESFGTSGQFYRTFLNDSIVFCQQNYHYSDDYGTKKTGKVYGYFNSKTGEDVTAYIDFFISSDEASKVPLFIK